MTHVNGSSPEVIEADIARQRDQLAATVDELQHRLDVKAQAKEKVAHLKDRATTDTGRPRPELAGVVDGFLGRPDPRVLSADPDSRDDAA